MNEVILYGNLTRDIEVRYTQTNKAVGQFTVAINNGKDKDGNNRPADFINCVIWETQAENMQKYTHKGSKVLVKGSIKNDNYEDEQGNKKYRTYVLASRVVFGDSQNSGQPLPTEPDYLKEKENTQQTTVPEENDPYKQFGEEITLNSDDLPF